MNASNKFGPALGDWYWNSLVNPNNPDDVWAYAWESVWARDLDNLRALGINCIRVYSMLYKQIGINGEVPTAATYPTLPTFLHRKFLDLCWNNGNNPIYVLVGIPMPFEMYKLKEKQPRVKPWVESLYRSEPEGDSIYPATTHNVQRLLAKPHRSGGGHPFGLTSR